jgi:hypothetical protein
MTTQMQTKLRGSDISESYRDHGLKGEPVCAGMLDRTMCLAAERVTGHYHKCWTMGQPP